MTETGPATALPERETGARRAAWLACLPWLAVLGTYGVCLALYAAGKSHHFFYFDEWIYVENADRDRLEHLFRPYFWYFHPISWRLYFVALFRRFGPDPAVFLTAQVALIWIAATLVHVVVHRVSGRHALGFLANLLYVGASATATDAYWKSCIAYPVAACFEVAFLACVLELMLVRARAGAVVLATAAAIAAYACAWMSRNNAIVLPFALVVLWGAGRHRWANGALLVTIAAAIASLLWYRFDLSPGAAGSVEVARTYRPANVVASWWAIFFGPPWRVDSELLSFIPGMRWGYAPLIPSRLKPLAESFPGGGVLMAVLALTIIGALARNLIGRWVASWCWGRCSRACRLSSVARRRAHDFSRFCSRSRRSSSPPPRRSCATRRRWIGCSTSPRSRSRRRSRCPWGGCFAPSGRGCPPAGPSAPSARSHGEWRPARREAG